ncbi:RNase adapter RapZ [Oceanomicrobium pacificus]|uniref:RNase adapter RapZ n=1 Tax=Oceanomicrobium pacificus TaxID=2692916 RepID=A0A6B0TRF4_9RHOB|nr:RNase adapter RapZ [Oceanomicrobium pacificus]MXU63944.1 RNase adapter RapZ [Oceanomicrobium pacificus]
MVGESEQQQVVLVTGPSGAGRSTCISILEDLGFEAIDNLPLSFIPRLLSAEHGPRPLALGVDVRTRDFSAAALTETLDDLTMIPGLDVRLLYLDARQEVLIRRYSETRRRHPLAPTESVQTGIERERLLLDDLRARVDILLDTSDLTPHDLRAQLTDWFVTEGGDAVPLAVSVQSFSYKRGLPAGVDMVFDCRFLRNPHWDADLRPRDGRDPEVGAYVQADPRFPAFLQRLSDLATFLLPAYRDEGKAYFAIGLGCTGGKHRSVYTAEKLANALELDGWRVSIRHRELERRTGPDVSARGTDQR